MEEKYGKLYALFLESNINQPQIFNIFYLHSTLFTMLERDLMEYINEITETKYKTIHDIKQKDVKNILDTYKKEIRINDDYSAYDIEVLNDFELSYKYLTMIKNTFKFKVLYFSREYEIGKYKDFYYIRFYDIPVFVSKSNEIPDENFESFEYNGNNYLIYYKERMSHNSQRYKELTKNYNLYSWYTKFVKHNAFVLPIKF